MRNDFLIKLLIEICIETINQNFSINLLFANIFIVSNTTKNNFTSPKLKAMASSLSQLIFMSVFCMLVQIWNSRLQIECLPSSALRISPMCFVLCVCGLLNSDRNLDIIRGENVDFIYAFPFFTLSELKAQHLSLYHISMLLFFFFHLFFPSQFSEF